MKGLKDNWRGVSGNLKLSKNKKMAQSLAQPDDTRQQHQTGLEQEIAIKCCLNRTEWI